VKAVLEGHELADCLVGDDRLGEGEPVVADEAVRELVPLEDRFHLFRLEDGG